MCAQPQPPSTTSSPAWHGVDPPSRSPLRRAKEGRPDSEQASRSLPSDRRGRLKNGNRPGDFLAAPRCGAHTRCGGECRQPAMPNGRCRLHGGLSTGPRTPAGLARSRRARWKHGARSAEVRALVREARAQLRRTRTLLIRMRAPSAGHGVHRSNSTAAPGIPARKVHHREHRDTEITEITEITEKASLLPRAPRAFVLPLCALCPLW